MEKINIKDISNFELLQFEASCNMLLNKVKNEYIAFKEQIKDSAKNEYQDLYRESLFEMEEKYKKYSSIRNKLLSEISNRLEKLDLWEEVEK